MAIFGALPGKEPFRLHQSGDAIAPPETTELGPDAGCHKPGDCAEIPPGSAPAENSLSS